MMDAATYSPLCADADGVITFAFLLRPEYAMISLMSAIEPLRIANRLAGKPLFRWQCFSEEGESVLASNEMSLSRHLGFKDRELPKNLFVNSSFNPRRYLSQCSVKWLQQIKRRGGCIGAFDTGCFLLAEANLLNGHCVTMHWEAVPVFAELYPEQGISTDLFVVDGACVTCAGGVAATDMMLSLIAPFCDKKLIEQICDQFIGQGVRDKHVEQRIGMSERLNIHNPRLLKVLKLMEANLASPITTADLAEQVHISLRQLERLFQRYLQMTPSRYYLKLRLTRAKQLLCETSLSVSQIALACGFGSPSQFSRSYRKEYLIAPNTARKDASPIVL